jgi:hypothetical protein
MAPRLRLYLLHRAVSLAILIPRPTAASLTAARGRLDSTLNSARPLSEQLAVFFVFCHWLPCILDRMPTPHPITGPLRKALNDRTELRGGIHGVAVACQVDYKLLLTFSQGRAVDFGAAELDRPATHLGLRLTLADAPKQKDAVGRRAR